VPTFAEANLPKMNAVTWFAVVAPPGTPAAIVNEYQKDMAAVLALPDVKAKFAKQGAVPRGWSPEQTARFIGSESEKWGKVIKSANVTLN
jgi:tripartite-type tricarboxylate transporter receptor subunit TctC